MLTLPLLLAIGAATLGFSAPIHERSVSWAEGSINALQSFYNSTTGLWGNDWWQSANSLTAIADLHAIDSSINQTAYQIYETTYNEAPKAFNFQGFINDFYDDEVSSTAG